MAHKSDRKGEVTTDLPAGACARDYLFALELKMGQLSTRTHREGPATFYSDGAPVGNARRWTLSA